MLKFVSRILYIYGKKEPYEYAKSALHTCQKSPIRVAKRALLEYLRKFWKVVVGHVEVCQQNCIYIHAKKEPHAYAKSALRTCQKSSIWVPWEIRECSCRTCWSVSAELLIYTQRQSPVHTPKVPYKHTKRVLFEYNGKFENVVVGHVEVCQQNYIHIRQKKSPVHTPKEPYTHAKRALFEYFGKFCKVVVGHVEVCQQNCIYMYAKKEPCAYAKRALRTCQKSPISVPWEIRECSCRTLWSLSAGLHIYTPKTAPGIRQKSPTHMPKKPYSSTLGNSGGSS